LTPCLLTPLSSSTAGASGSNATVIASVVGVPLVQDAIVFPSQGYSEMGVSLDDRKNAWRLEHKGKSSSLDPAYWAKRAADRDLIFVSDPDSVSEHESADSDDSGMEEVLLTPEEQLLKDHYARREEIISHAHRVWDAVEDLHGWTVRVKREWFSAHTGLGRRIGPWEVYTRESGDTWLRESFPLE
jgi:hypothetical protein